MIYRAVEVVWIFGTGWNGWQIEGILRGPRGPKNPLVEQRDVRQLCRIEDEHCQLSSLTF